MRKVFTLIVITAIILILIFIAIKDNFNLKKIITDIEKQNDLTITLNNESKWNYYPWQRNKRPADARCNGHL